MGEGVERGALVGRGRELAHLERALEELATGRGRTVVIGGEAGIGKSRLVTALVDRATARDVAVLSGDCLPSAAGAIPYGPFVEAMRVWIRSTEPGAVAGLLGASRGEVSRLLPGIAPSPERTGSVPDDQGGQARLFEALLGLFERRAAVNGLLLVVEDVQWADDGTRSLITFLSRSLRLDPVLLLVTVRTEDAGDPGLARWLGELERDAWVERIELGPLDRLEVAAFLRSIDGVTPSADQVVSISARSGGNPFYLEQLAAMAGGTGTGMDRARSLPPRLRDVLVARLAELPDTTRIVLRAAATAGGRVDDDVLGAVLGTTSTSIADALRPAIAQGILEEVVDPDGRSVYAFHHALLAEVAEGELLQGERDRLHAAFANELERRATLEDGVVAPAELAFHWVAAGDRGRAIPALIDAGLAAEGVYAFSDARRHYDRALALWPAEERQPAGTALDRVAVLQHAAESAVLSGAYADAVARGRQAIVTAELDEVIDGKHDPVRLGALHERLRWYLYEAGDLAAAEAAVETALRLIPTQPPSGLRARALAQAAGLRLFGGSPTEAAELARQAIDVARAVGGAAEEALALGVLGWATAVTGDVDDGIATYREGLAIAERLGGVEGIALGHANLAALLDRVGRSEASLVAARTGFEIARRLGVVRTYGGGLLGHASKALFDLGRWEEASAAAEEGLALDPVGSSAIILHIEAARVATNRGRFEDAGQHLRAAGAIEAGADRHRWALVAAQAELDAWLHRPDRIREAARVALAGAAADAQIDPGLGWLAWHALRAEADAAVDARARHDDGAVLDALARVEPLVARVRQSTPDPPSGPVDARRAAVAGLCLGELSRLELAPDADAWGRTADAWAAIGRPMLAAYARFRAAEAGLARGGTSATKDTRAAAVAALRAAHATARGLGAEPLLAEIERLARHARIDLLAAGGPDAESPLGLTARETEVMRLVAAGRSNQEIADALFITRKTASVHVSNILGKLGVSNRVEAAAVAQRLGLGIDPRD